MESQKLLKQGTRMCRPIDLKSSKKYDGYGGRGTGLYNWASFNRFENLSREAKHELMMASNNSLSKNTWDTYQTALRHLIRCRRDTGWSLNLPLEEEEILHFVVWLRQRRGLQATSVENMLSAVKKVRIFLLLIDGNCCWEWMTSMARRPTSSTTGSGSPPAGG